MSDHLRKSITQIDGLIGRLQQTKETLEFILGNGGAEVPLSPNITADRQVSPTGDSKDEILKPRTTPKSSTASVERAWRRGSLHSTDQTTPKSSTAPVEAAPEPGSGAAVGRTRFDFGQFLDYVAPEPGSGAAVGRKSPSHPIVLAAIQKSAQPLQLGDLVQATGLPRSTVNSALFALLKKKVLTKNGFLWSLSAPSAPLRENSPLPPVPSAPALVPEDLAEKVREILDGKWIDALSPVSKEAIQIGQLLPEQFSWMEAKALIGSKAGYWVARWKESGRIKSLSPNHYLRTADFAAK